MSDPAEIYDAVRREVQTVVVGNDDAVELLTVALLTRGHVLVEGVPGIAKTTLATLFSQAIGLDTTRIQMTPDLLPADITGTQIYRGGEEFKLQRGPVFVNVVVVDEINRAMPKTQSALLEAMEERQVTIEGETLPLPRPFMIVATQNPLESEGTFQLPVAQRDRFRFKLTIDVPDRNDEYELLDRFDDQPTLDAEGVQQVLTREEIVSARETVSWVYVDPKIKGYILDLMTAAREHPYVEHGGSPRASRSLLDGGKAVAALNGRSYVLPDDVARLVEPTLVHRLQLNSDAQLTDVDVREVIEDVVDSVDVPDASAESGPGAGFDDGSVDDRREGRSD